MAETPTEEISTTTDKGREIYKQLEGQGILEGHDGEHISIDTKSGLYAFGEGLHGFDQLQTIVAKKLGKKEVADPNWGGNRVYSRRIGELDRLPFRATFGHRIRNIGE